MWGYCKLERKNRGWILGMSGVELFGAFKNLVLVVVSACDAHHVADSTH